MCRSDFYLKETLDVLKNEDAAIGEVWLLRDLRTTGPHVDLVKNPILAELLLVLARQVVAKRGRHFGPAARLKGVEDEDARPGN